MSDELVKHCKIFTQDFPDETKLYLQLIINIMLRYACYLTAI